MKIEVRYEPRKEIIIHEYTKYDSYQELIDASVKGLPAGSVLTALRWVGGVLLAFSAMPINTVTTQELIEGRLHWDHVSFASMPEYQEQVITNAGVTVVMGNVSGNSVFAEIAKFLRKEFLQKSLK
jgi:hypothetical protein